MPERAAMRAAAALLLLALAGNAQAASCELALSDLAFGAFALTGDDIESSATITVNCTDDGGLPAVTYDIGISPGLGGSFAQRAMLGPGTLEYNLYQDASRTLVWGDGTDGTTTVAGSLLVPTLTSATHTAFGRIPGSQPGVVPGTYSDQLLITLTY
jgi:spore coat protein U-like protein